MVNRKLTKSMMTVGVALLFAGSAAAEPLEVVEVNAPDVWCVFAADCTLTVADSSGPITLKDTAGEGFLQSRTTAGNARGEAGLPGEGLIPYQYRIDLRAISGGTGRSCIRELRIASGPIEQVDYNKDGTPDDVFVVTSGGLGSVRPSAVRRAGKNIIFEFNPPVCAGESSYFFGLASAEEPDGIQARLRTTGPGKPLTIEARAPGGAER